jgi:hypothetical protein
MNLQDFITETITQISTSVVDIQKYFDEQGIDAVVNPKELYYNGGKGQYNPEYKDEIIRNVENIEFDVAVTVESDNKKEVGGKLKVFDMGIGVEGSQVDKLANVSKVRFKIPLVMPHGRTNKAD